MRFSIILLNNDKKNLEKTLESVRFQTLTDVETVIVENEHSFSNSLIEKRLVLNGEYCLFLMAGDRLANDYVLEELTLNNLDRDIIFGNIILNEFGYEKENYVIFREPMRASDLFLSKYYIQSVIIKTSLLTQLNPIDSSLATSIWTLVVRSVLVNNRTYKQIQIFISRCITLNFPDFDKNYKSQENSIFRELLPLYYEDYNDLINYKMSTESEEAKVLNKIKTSILFKTFMNFRRKMIEWGFYEYKSKYKLNKYHSRLKQGDEQKKQEVYKKIFDLRNNLLQRRNDDSDVIVSLTSYGKRVSDFLPYTLYSIFSQTKLPNRIVLFLDYGWNDNNIPPILKKIQDCGLEIEYCKDLRSYKKLIPALYKFSKNIIITIDDDMYYDKNLIYKFLSEYEKSDKKTVLCNKASIVQKIEGHYAPYSKWFEGKYGNTHSLYSPIGVDGILYPPNIFDDEILREEIFMEYLPTNDDLWFWLMECRLGIKCNLLKHEDEFLNIPVNHLDIYVEENSTALYFQNVFHHKNDENLNKVLNYYGML